ncbi:MAG: macro domain-containing protein [Acidobacteriota bacterium]
MSGKTFRIIHGDIADLECEAIVNAWNRNLIPWFLLFPQGVSGAIKRKGGNKIFRELMGKGMIPLGQAVYTNAGRLKAKYVIHVASLDLLWRASERSIRDSTRNALELALQLGVSEIALPLIGTGIGGFSPSQAYMLMKAEIDKYTDKFIRIYLVIYDRISLQFEYSCN